MNKLLDQIIDKIVIHTTGGEMIELHDVEENPASMMTVDVTRALRVKEEEAFDYVRFTPGPTRITLNASITFKTGHFRAKDTYLTVEELDPTMPPEDIQALFARAQELSHRERMVLIHLLAKP